MDTPLAEQLPAVPVVPWDVARPKDTPLAEQLPVVLVGPWDAMRHPPMREDGPCIQLRFVGSLRPGAEEVPLQRWPRLLAVPEAGELELPS